MVLKQQEHNIIASTKSSITTAQILMVYKQGMRSNERWLYNMALYFRQRQEGRANSSIEGKKINNYGTCSVKEVRKLSPQIVEMAVREETFESDSFKQILSRRSLGAINKENVSGNNKKLRRIQQEPSHSKSGPKLKPKSKKSSEIKQSTTSLNKFAKNNKKSKERKSMSPIRDQPNYRSGPSDKRAMVSLNQYISANNQSKTSRDGMAGSKSQRNLTERLKNPLKSTQNMLRKKEQKEKVNITYQKKKSQKRKNVSKANLFINTSRPATALPRTQSLAKEFDGLIKYPNSKREKHHKQDKSQLTTIKKDTSKGKLKKNKDKRIVVISNNNSKNLIERAKAPLDFSQDSHESPGKLLSMKYEHQKNLKKKKRERLSFEPTKKKQKKIQNIKTQVLSAEKDLTNKNGAATMIQKVFRGYITRKYLKQFKQVMGAVIDIQRLWRGYQGRKRFKEFIEKKRRQKNLKIKSFHKIEQILNEAEQNKSVELNTLLEDILRQQNVNNRIKQKISQFLKKQGKVSSRSSLMSHSELEIKSQKRFFEEIQRKKYIMNSPLIKGSPKLEKSELLKSPQLMVQSLLTIQEFHREKLISNANLQRQGLASLAMKNLFSPKTHEIKQKEIDERLASDLKKFQSSMGEVIKSCKQNDDLIRPIKPFSGLMTPERKEQLIMRESGSGSQSPSLEMNNSQRKIQDLSMQLLEYYQQKTQLKDQNLYLQFDSSYQFIEEYLLTLFEYLRQKGEDYRQQFLNIMKEHRNLEVGLILKNLNTVTEDEDDDNCFKLPMYKYLEHQEREIISYQMSQQFNDSFTKLQRHQLSYQHKNLQDQYLKMLIDCINQALNCQRTSRYLFTEMALSSAKDGIKIKQIEALEAEDCTKSEAEFSFFFAKAMNQIYNWAHQQCGGVPKQEIEAGAMIELNENRMKNYLKEQAKQSWDCYDQLLQVIVGVADTIFDQIILEEGVSLYF